MHKITMRLFGCPEDDELINCLYYAGPSFPTSSLTFSSLRTVPLASARPSFRTDVDVHRLENVIHYNCFTPRRDNPSFIISPTPTTQREPLALYVIPSLFNHSCLPNAMWVCNGDVMVIRSMEKIECDREITISYSLLSDKQAQDGVIESRLGRKCDCARCTLDREDVSANQRLYSLHQDNIQNKLRRGMMGQQLWGTRKDATSYLRKLLSISPSPDFPSVQLFLAHTDLMQCVENEAQIKADDALTITAIEHGFDALKAAGFSDIDARTTIGNRGKAKSSAALVIPFSKTRVPAEVPVTHVLQVLLHISANFNTLSERLLAERWLRGAWWSKFRLL